MDYSTSIPSLFSHIHSFEIVDPGEPQQYAETCLNLLGRTITLRVRREEGDGFIRFLVDHPVLQNTMSFSFTGIRDGSFDLHLSIESRRSYPVALALKMLMFPVLIKRNREMSTNLNRLFPARMDS